VSTLTKALIILLTVASIFLCGIIVTYVANSENYRQKWTDLRNAANAAKENEENAKKQLNETIAQADQEKVKLNGLISSLRTQISDLEVKLTAAEREKALLLQKVDSWTTITKDFYETNDKQGQLLKNTLAELKRVQADLEKEQSQHKETTAALIEKMAIVTMFEEKSRRLLEEKTELQDKLDKILRQYGKTVPAPTAVTPTKDKARLAPVTKDIELKGQITKVDLKNAMAEISIGAADGVKESMKFHVTRGDQFICDILIMDVDVEKAVGELQLVQPSTGGPKTGDQISTGL
jgi:DNA repair exonuclease SbcCD ATPase subunit